MKTKQAATETPERREPTEYGAMAVMPRKLEGDNRTIRFVATTAMRDRYNSDIPLTGWNFKYYKKNPVVSWSHNLDTIPGVGITTNIVKETVEDVPAWVFDVDFNKPVMSFDLPEVLYQYAKERRIRACSVGFIPIKSRWIDLDSAEEKEWREENPDCTPTKVYERKELMELAICNVGACREALSKVHQNAYGRGSSSLREHLAWIERSLVGNDRTGVIYVPMQLAMVQGQTSNESRWPFSAKARCECELETEDEEDPETNEDETEEELDANETETEAASNAAGSAVPAEKGASAQTTPPPAAPPARETSETATVTITSEKAQGTITITG